jgi:hypothetical protein
MVSDLSDIFSPLRKIDPQPLDPMLAVDDHPGKIKSGAP